MLNPQHIRERVDRFLEQRIEPAAVRERLGVQVESWNVPDEPVPFAYAAKQEYKRVEAGYRWGAPWSTTWFRIAAQMPESLRHAALELVVDLGFVDAQVGFQAEGLAYATDGTVVKGVNPRSRRVPVGGLVDAHGRLEVYIEAAGNPTILTWGMGLLEYAPTPLGDPRTAGDAPRYTLGIIDLVEVDPTVIDLAMDLRVISELERELPEQSARRWSVLKAMGSTVDALDPADIRGTAHRAREHIGAVLAAPAESSAHILSAVGHAHIDSAWLWPFRETRRKVARTVANVLNLMDSDPDLIYAMSSAQQFDWLKADHPALFERVRARVTDGRFVPVGGMWVESDTNMPSGEAMVRQFLEGARFFREEFGMADTSVVWLPDSFGYSAALPQIIRGIGSRWFLTQKISWNTTNRFPHHTFWWEGIDGSRVFTHFPSADMYNSQLLGSEVAHAARNFADKGSTNRSLIPFGFGDGGGGPTKEMMARARRLRDLEGSPRVQIEPPDAFFASAENELPDAPTWVGELYLEFHRGVLTSQAATKRGNRLCEALFREAELWSSQATVRTRATYPADELRALWRRFLLLQFHDVLPGSSIAWVHDEAEREYGEIATALEHLIGVALSGFTEDGAGELVANASPFNRNGIGAHSIGAPERPQSAARVAHDSETDHVRLVNETIDAVIDANGAVVSLRHVPSNREVVPAGERLGELQLFHDTPNRWDAWDIDEHRGPGRGWAAIEPPEHGVDDRGVWARFNLRAGGSRIEQTIRLDHDGRMLRFTTDVDWHERETLLKVVLPLSVASERWAGETQFGHVFRPTTANTSWEAAKYEACAHRWAHVGEPGFGVALLNATNYGHEVRRATRENGAACSMMSLSLLRGPNFPDPAADLGRHKLIYAIAPGAEIADAVELGYALGDATRAAHLIPVNALATSSEPAVVIDTVKLADDGSGDVIVRLFEARGTQTTTTLHFDVPNSGAWSVDLLERVCGENPALECDGGDVQLVFHPFQIATVRFTPSALSPVEQKQ